MDPEIEEPVVPAEPTAEVDPFDAAFAEASEPGTAPVVPAEPAAPVVPAVVEPVVPAVAAEPTAAEAAAAIEAAAVAAVAQTTPATPAPAEPAPVQVPANLDPAFLAQAIVEANERTRQAAAAAQVETPAPYVPVTADAYLNDTQKAQIAKFKAEWPDESPAIEMMVEARAQAIMANAQHALVTQLNTVLAPLFQSTEKAEVNSHMSVIRSAHPDLDQVIGNLPAWVATQPQFLQPAYNSILQKGSAADVVGLLNEYKKASSATGAAPVTPAPAVAQETKPAKNPVSAAAVAATAAVPATQRQNPTTKGDPNDFDGAFDEALGSTS